MESFIEFSDVSKSYGGKLIVEGISFNIKPSTITVLVGPNGAGKSTIAKMISGAEKQNSGIIKSKEGLKKAYVPQHTSLSSSLPISCKYYAEILNLSKSDIIDTFYETDFKLDKIWESQLSEISSGQRQLFFISTAFAAKADIIILDEPTSFLDVDFEEKFYQRINSIRSNSAAAIFMISHDLHNVIETADQVLCINHHICCTGKPFHGNNDLATNIGRYIHTHNHTHN